MTATADQIANVRRLADGLDKVAEEWPERFHLNHYIGITGEAEDSGAAHYSHMMGEHPESCGTTGCAIGWAPYLLGIPIRTTDYWHEYADEHLGVTSFSDYTWLFMPDDYSLSEYRDPRAPAARLREWADEQARQLDAVEVPS